MKLYGALGTAEEVETLGERTTMLRYTYMPVLLNIFSP
jgi:hypothetical protein